MAPAVGHAVHAGGAVAGTDDLALLSNEQDAESYDWDDHGLDQGYTNAILAVTIALRASEE